PKSVELAQALSLEDSAAQGQQLNVRDVVNGDWAPPVISNVETPALTVIPDPPAQMDPETGEVPAPVEPIQNPEPDVPPADPCADLLLLIEEAQTVADLDALSRDIGRLRNGERARVVEAWKARKSALSQAA
ncbi:MAG TPA: hypothetical protein DCS21_05205, partial [Gammaproteobacteria bacterium]|nr:hypothetical protein [Gammaproteobacteria bacterium]